MSLVMKTTTMQWLFLRETAHRENKKRKKEKKVTEEEDKKEVKKSRGRKQ